MRTLALCMTAIVAVTLFTAAPAEAEIAWQNNLRDAHAKAQAEGKLLLLHFYSDNCVWCDRLEAGAFQSPEIAAAIDQRFVAVKVHANTNPKITTTFKVTKFPSDVIVTTTGQALSHTVSPQDPKRYLGMLAGAVAPRGVNNIAQSQPTAPQQTAPAPAASPTVNVATNSPPSYAQPAATQPTATQPPAAPQYAAMVPVQAQPQSTQQPPVAQQSPVQQFAAQTAPATSPVMPQLPSYTANQPPVATASAPVTASVSGFAMPPSAQPTFNTGTAGQLVGSRTAGMSLGLPPESTVPPTASTSPQEIKIDPAAIAAVDAKKEQTTRPELALDGFCPVTVIGEDQWLEGNPEFGVVHLGKLYLFASASKMQTFLKDPTPYTPVLNEIDVVRFYEEHVVVPGKRDYGVKDPVHNRMFLFADEQAMNHFIMAHTRYTDSAIELMKTAVLDANPQR